MEDELQQESLDLYTPSVPDNLILLALPPAKRVQSSLHGHLISTSSSTKNKLDEKIAEFVFGCNIPFNVVDHPLFKAMIAELRPGYKPPFRKNLDFLLDKVYSNLHSSMKTKLEGKTVTIQQDGWSAPKNDPVISNSVTCEGKGFFIDAQCTGSTPKTADKCKEMLI